MSWHVNSKGKSVIEEVVKQFSKKKSAYIHIFTENDDFYVFDDDKCIIAKGFIYIQRDDGNATRIEIININKVESISIVDKHDVNTE